MDTMAERRPIVFFFGRYDNNLDAQFETIAHPQSVFGLSDGGAHCGVLCDASVPTYILGYAAWGRPRGTLPLDFVVHKMSRDPAEVYGLRDRGLIAAGYKADLNLIDFDALELEAPEMSYDLPAGVFRSQVQYVTSGQPIDGPGYQWVVAGADGSIHIVGDDGQFHDRFGYGEDVTGLAVVELPQGKALVVATGQAVSAWKLVQRTTHTGS